MDGHSGRQINALCPTQCFFKRRDLASPMASRVSIRPALLPVLVAPRAHLCPEPLEPMLHASNFDSSCQHKLLKFMHRVELIYFVVHLQGQCDTCALYNLYCTAVPGEAPTVAS